MRAPVRLGLYAVVLVAVFSVAFVTGGAVVPERAVQNWTGLSDNHSGDHAGENHAGEDYMNHGVAGHGGQGAGVTGLALESGGYRLGEVSAPTRTGGEGDLALTVLGPDGEPVTDFELSHDKELHLIVVRADGQMFRHVHPDRGEEGRWFLPWTWDEAGSYRVFADFVPAQTGEEVTLSTVVHVAGDLAPAPAPEPVTTTHVDGYEVSVAGGLTPGVASTLTMTVTLNGEPVTELEPYLGAFGHLVVLREGDLAYLHVHPHGGAPEAGESSGPEIVFEATAPTPGRYLLYLDFQVDGQVRTAPLVIDAAAGGEATGSDTDTPEPDTGDGHDDEGAGHDH